MEPEKKSTRKEEKKAVRKAIKKTIKRIAKNSPEKSKMKLTKILEAIKNVALKKESMTLDELRQLIKDMTYVFVQVCLDAGYPKRQITRITTKLRDAGRRSPPWKPTSSRVPGRPQDGADGNRTLRWLLSSDHKFYAEETPATLTEVKYYLQLLSMQDAPPLPEDSIQECFGWLIEHDVIPGYYLDPIQLIPISLTAIMEDARRIQSGHLHPLDRGGKHEPKNAFLMLHRSNQLQGNLTVEELIQLMQEIVKRHAEHHKH
jgi:hypothetical protein